MTKQEILQTQNLTVAIQQNNEYKSLLKNINFSLIRGEIHGLVGESGSGKSLFSRTLLRLESPARITAGSILLKGTQLADTSSKSLNNIRGKIISLVLQNPYSAMNPVFTMGTQFKDSLTSLPKNRRSMDLVYTLLEKVGISAAKLRCRQYPHEWSGGMLQRAQLVMALLPSPEIMILDEITSSLDPTIGLQIIELIRSLRKDGEMTFLFITHDLAMAYQTCDRISVMQSGRIVETITPQAFMSAPKHPYSAALVAGDFSCRP